MRQSGRTSEQTPQDSRRRFLAVAAAAAGLAWAGQRRGGILMAKSTPLPATAPALRVDADIPAGNIVVQRVDGDTVHVRQDLRDTAGWWFYWHFRAAGAAGRTLTFQFANPRSFTLRGPAASTDGGKTWRWLGREAVKGSAFTYRFAAGADDVRFSMGMPYVQANLDAFLAPYKGKGNLKVATHCRTRKGRPVVGLHFGRLDGRCTHRVLLTARHHACEMMANYVLEGLIAAVLDDDKDPAGRWLRENVEFLAVPFMDTDGVEDGDQGKNRKPHDHNRDYKDKSIYPSVRALRELAPKWSDGKLAVGLDLHCPYIVGGRDNHLFFVGGPDQAGWKRTLEFGKVLRHVQTGALRYTGEHDVPHGVGWNKAAVGPCGKWMATLPGIRVAATLEVPYASAGGKDVTPASARAFGRALARATRRYLAEN